MLQHKQERLSADGRTATLSRVSDGRPRQTLPFGNTGALDTCDKLTLGNEVEVSIDWLGFSASAEYTVDELMPGAESWTWVKLDRGGLGYRACEVAGHIRRFTDGTAAMGQHFEVSGKGCRELEATKVVTDWQGYAKYLLELGTNISRLDIALDAKDGQLNMDTMRQCIDKGEITTRWKEIRNVNKLRIGGGKTGDTIYFGSGASDVFCRIYDKGLQTETLDAGQWVRVEVQFRNQRAKAMLQAFATGGVAAVASILRGYLDFKEGEEGDSNKSRWETVSWWSSFLDNCSKVRLKIATAAQTLESAHTWLLRQVAPILALFCYRDGGYETVQSICLEGRKRLRPQHYALLSTVG